MAVPSSLERSPSRRGSIVLRLAILAVFLVGIGAVVAYQVVRTVMAPEWLRANVVPLFEAAYGRRMLFEDFRLRPRSIALTGVRVVEEPEFAAESSTFLYIDRLVIGFDPFGLLRRAFLVDFVRLVRPEIHLLENEQGRWNVASLFGSQNEDERSTSPAHARSDFRLVITRVEVEDGTLRVRRASQTGDNARSEAVARNLRASVLFPPMTGFLDYETKTSIELPNRPPASVEVLGALDLSGPRVEFEIAVDGLDIDALAEFGASAPTSKEKINFDELVDTDVDHEILVVASNVRLAGVALRSARVEVSASRSGIDVRRVDVATFGGEIRAAASTDLTVTPPTTAASLRADNLDIAQLAAALGRNDVAAALPGRASGDVSVVAKGASRDEIIASALGGTANADSPAGIGAHVRLALGRVDVSSLAGLMPKAALGEKEKPLALGTATVDLHATAKRIEAEGIDLRDAAVEARWAAGKLDVRDLKATAWGGDLHLSGDVDFTSREPRWTAAVSLARARYEDFIPQTPSWAWTATTGVVDVGLDVAGRGLTADSFLRALRESDAVGRSAASIDGRVTIAVDALDLDLVGKPPRIRDEYGPLDLGNTKLRLDVTAKRVQLWKLEYADVTAAGVLERNVIDVERIAGAISGGTLDLAGTVDFGRKGFDYEGRGSFREVETGLFATTYLPPDVGQISGKGSASFEFDLSGTKARSALDSLRLDSYVALHSGRVHKSKLLDKIAKVTGVKEFDRPDLTRCGGDVHISNRRLSSQQLVFGGADARVFLVGSVGFDSSVDAEIWLGFSPDTKRQLFSRGIFLPYITDDKGWTYVPFTARGDLKDPEIETTPEAVRSTAMRALPDATERIVRESSRLLPGGETLVGGSIDAVKSILEGLGRVLQVNSARAKGDVPVESKPRPAKPTPPHAPANYRDD
jgi:uncharacterized protein involved in outer membrane biogenesis